MIAPPKGTPREVIGKLNAAAVEALGDQAVRSRIVELGFEVFPREYQTPDSLGALVKSNAQKWWSIIKELGIRQSDAATVAGEPKVVTSMFAIRERV